MKELILLRHAKSSWDHNLEDRNLSIITTIKQEIRINFIYGDKYEY